MVVRLKEKRNQKRAAVVLAALFILIYTVNAASDSFIFIDTPDIPMCLASNNISNHACHGEALQLEGTKDHFLYIIPSQAVPTNATFTQRLNYFAFTPFTLLLGTIGLLAAVILCSWLAVTILSLTGMIKNGSTVTKMKMK